MAEVYKTPGVYVKEISVFPPSIAEVETAIPAFIGFTAKASVNGADLLKKPVRIKSLLEYEEMFGAAESETSLQVTIDDTLDGTTLVSRIIKAEINGTASPYIMYYALRLYFANGGGPCFIVSAGDYGTTINDDDLSEALAQVATEDEPTILVFPDAVALDSGEYYALIVEALNQCRDLQDRVTLLDVVPDDTGAAIPDPIGLMRNTLALDLDQAKYGAAYFPYLNTFLNYTYADADVAIVHNVDGAAAGTPIGATLADVKTANTEVYNLILREINRVTVTLPPAAAIAGVCARVDSSRGVWKAPANVALAQVKAPAVKISDQDQADMNVDAVGGKSVNAIRFFTGKGVMVWGARTLAGNDNEWRYLSVRRFYNFAEESIKKGSQWVVFEPNDANTWIRVKGMIENFLVKQWRAGALAGSTPEKAFFVKVGLGVTMTTLDILEGRMNIEIGMAVVRPAEFIILRFSHKLQEA